MESGGVMPRMTLDELREVATRNKSVNVHLASAYDLRWHDPFWLSAWERWQKARNTWDANRDRWFDDIRRNKGQFEEGDSVYCPSPDRITDPELATMAREYIEAREAYHSATKLYLLES